MACYNLFARHRLRAGDPLRRGRGSVSVVWRFWRAACRGARGAGLRGLARPPGPRSAPPAPAALARPRGAAVAAGRACGPAPVRGCRALRGSARQPLAARARRVSALVWRLPWPGRPPAAALLPRGGSRRGGPPLGGPLSGARPGLVPPGPPPRGPRGAAPRRVAPAGAGLGLPPTPPRAAGGVLPPALNRRCCVCTYDVPPGGAPTANQPWHK